MKSECALIDDKGSDTVRSLHRRLLSSILSRTLVRTNSSRLVALPGRRYGWASHADAESDIYGGFFTPASGSRLKQVKRQEARSSSSGTRNDMSRSGQVRKGLISGTERRHHSAEMEDYLRENDQA